MRDRGLRNRGASGGCAHACKPELPPCHTRLRAPAARHPRIRRAIPGRCRCRRTLSTAPHAFAREPHHARFRSRGPRRTARVEAASGAPPRQQRSSRRRAPSLRVLRALTSNAVKAACSHHSMGATRRSQLAATRAVAHAPPGRGSSPPRVEELARAEHRMAQLAVVALSPWSLLRPRKTLSSVVEPSSAQTDGGPRRAGQTARRRWCSCVSTYRGSIAHLPK